MARELPAELLREILSPQLVVSDDMFADSGAVLPFSKVEKSASDVLLVCKSWMRVATPCLYSTVIVRSIAQAKALAFALTNNPEFGKFIRRLRVEGAYGQFIWAAVKTAPNITDLCMTLAVWSDVSAAGLVKSLAHINPRRVILTLAPDRPIKNKNHQSLLNALCIQVHLWTRLKFFKFASTRVPISNRANSSDYVVFSSIVTALCASSWLEEVQLALTDSNDTTIATIHRLLEANATRIVTVYDDSPNSWLGICVNRLHALTSPLLLPRIHTKTPSHSLGSTYKSLEVSLTGVSGSGDAEPWLSNPFYKPLDSVDPLVRRALLMRIFKHVLETKLQPEATYFEQSQDWFDASLFDAAVARVLLQVSQEFKSVVTEVLIKHAYIEEEEHVERVLKTISTTPTLSTRTRTLHFKYLGPPTPAQVSLLKRCSHLVEASIGFSPAAIQALGHAGNHTTLRKLDLSTTYYKLAILQGLDIDSFTALEELTINCSHYSPTPTKLRKPKKSAGQRVTLPRLRRLYIKVAPLDIVNSILSYDFPQLEYIDVRNYGIDATGLEYLLLQHGGRIQEVHLCDISTALRDALPEMVELHWSHPVRDIPSLSHSFAIDGHAKLRILRVSAPIPIADQRTKGNMQLNEMWKEFLTKVITRSKFPALEQIQVMEGADFWPVSERNIKRSIWAGFARVLDQQGITLTDREGRAWRRRLQ